MSEKLCIFCKHFDWSSIETGPDYSEYTGGDTSGGATCKMGIYTDERPYSAETFREIFLRAESCKHYARP